MAEEWIHTHPEQFEKGEFVTFAIVLKSSNELIGAIGLTLHQEYNHAEPGYWVRKSYWNQGYCTEAAIEVARYGFEIVSLNRIHAIHLSRDSASKLRRKPLFFPHIY